ncbi:MAG: VOC family protein [Oceanococcus sp.]
MSHPTPALPDSLAPLLLGLRHIGVVTEDREASLQRLKSLFGLHDEDITRIPTGNEPADTRFAFFSLGGVPYELIEPVSDEFREILLKSGHGVNHVCYNVSDLHAAVDVMQAQGVRLGHVTSNGIVELPQFRMAYFNPTDTAGVLIELVEQRTE